MKFISMPNILRANKLFSRLCAADPQSSIEMELYSCKQTRFQRMHYDIPKPLRFYISALEEAFGDHDFSESAKSFCSTTYANIRDEISFKLFKIQRNYEDVEESVGLFSAVLGQCVSLRNSVYYTVTQLYGDEEERKKVFLIHDRKRKRVVIIKVSP
ncbi:hypothetical protein PAEPH01_2203 [Pancytospora epiphaga]|nr:hypothetical protein PAEPH01_2203 [Pancytospora epiphaga]